MPLLEKPSATLYFETVAHGERPWVTLINGHTRTSRDFKMMVRHLDSAGFDTLTFDNRGCGQTKCAPGFTLTDMQQDVIDLWQHLRIQQSHLVGLSMGGFVAQSIAVQYPNRLGKLVLVSTTCQHSELRTGSWGSTLAEVQSQLAGYFAPSFVGKNRPLIQAMAKQILKDGAAFQQDAQQQKDAIHNFDLSQAIGRITAQTLVIHGQDDRIIPASAGEYLAKNIVGARLRNFADTGHLLLAERPKELYQSIGDFLASADQPN